MFLLIKHQQNKLNCANVIYFNPNSRSWMIFVCQTGSKSQLLPNDIKMQIYRLFIIKK